MSNKALPVILGLGAGVLALVLIARPARAATPPDIEIPAADIPTTEEIMAAGSLAELNAWYNLIGELFILGKLSYEEYQVLYNVYATRWSELTGVSI